MITSENLSQLFPSEPEATPIHLDKTSFSQLFKSGIRGLAIIMFDEEWGPIVKYYYLRRSKLVSRLLSDKVFPVELAIAGKFADEIKLRDGTKILIESFQSNESGREKIHYIVVEVSKYCRESKIRNILKMLRSNLEKTSKLDNGVINHALKKILMRNSKKLTG